MYSVIFKLAVSFNLQIIHKSQTLQSIFFKLYEQKIQKRIGKHDDLNTNHGHWKGRADMALT